MKEEQRSSSTKAGSARQAVLRACGSVQACRQAAAAGSIGRQAREPA